MAGFVEEGRELRCDGVPLAAIAGAAGTPIYVYSAAAIRERYQEIDRALGAWPHRLHYALKANSTLAVARLLRGLGSAVDANSGGEIEVALRAGFAPAEIVFTGVGKAIGELERAVALGVKAVNAESAGELERIGAAARAAGKRAAVALRVNPDIDAESHPHVTTGLRHNKFGVPLGEARALCRQVSNDPALRVIGLHVHIGSQITSLGPLRRAAGTLAALAQELRRDGVALEHLDLGGGLGISYDGSPVPSPAEYAEAVLRAGREAGLPLLIEPGRAIVGQAGALVTRVVDVKRAGSERWFVVLDAGMTELIRPALYGAFHRIQPLERRAEPDSTVDIVGPLCESADVLGSSRHMPLPRVGDLLAVLDAGAYGSVMASNYNRRPLPPEALVENGSWRLIRRRQTLDDLLALEE